MDHSPLCYPEGMSRAAELPPLPPFLPDLLAFDLDGTLLADGGQEIPESTVAGLELLRPLGVKFAVVTGRDSVPPQVLSRLQPHAAATNNGGRLEVGGELRHQARFSPQDLQAVLGHELENAGLTLFTEEGLFVEVPQGGQPEPWMTKRGFRPLSEFSEQAALKVGFYHPGVVHHAQRLRQSHPHLVMTGAQEPYPHFLTVTPAGADKAAGLTLLAQALDVSLERTAAFGDSDNDEVMLELAGFAVQVGTLPLLRPHADAQLSSHLELGAYLERLAALA